MNNDLIYPKFAKNTGKIPIIGTEDTIILLKKFIDRRIDVAIIADIAKKEPIKKFIAEIVTTDVSDTKETIINKFNNIIDLNIRLVRELSNPICVATAVNKRSTSTIGGR